MAYGALPKFSDSGTDLTVDHKPNYSHLKLKGWNSEKEQLINRLSIP